MLSTMLNITIFVFVFFSRRVGGGRGAMRYTGQKQQQKITKVKRAAIYTVVLTPCTIYKPLRWQLELCMYFYFKEVAAWVLFKTHVLNYKFEVLNASLSFLQNATLKYLGE